LFPPPGVACFPLLWTKKWKTNSPIILFPSLKLSLQFEHFFENKEINGRYQAIFI